MEATITTEKRSGDWIAYAFGDRRVWEAGRSEMEAYGKLMFRLQKEGHIMIFDTHSCGACGGTVEHKVNCPHWFLPVP